MGHLIGLVEPWPFFSAGQLGSLQERLSKAKRSGCPKVGKVFIMNGDPECPCSCGRK